MNVTDVTLHIMMITLKPFTLFLRFKEILELGVIYLKV